jgi:hypothetical protein
MNPSPHGAIGTGFDLGANPYDPKGPLTVEDLPRRLHVFAAGVLSFRWKGIGKTEPRPSALLLTVGGSVRMLPVSA